MSEKNLKIAIMVVIFIIITITSILIYIFSMNKKEYEEEVAGDENAVIEKNENIMLLKDNSIFYTAKNIVQGYLNVNASKSKEVYNLLDKDYIINNNITVENVFEHLPNLGNHILYYPQQVYIKEMQNGDILYSYGQTETFEEDQERNIIKNKDLQDIFLIIKIDYENATFSIEPIQKQEYEDIINEKVLKNPEINIQKNKYNTLTYTNISDDTVAANYIADFRQLCQEDVDKAYASLEESYKTKRFPSINVFKKYIQSIQLTNMYIISCEKQILENKNVYICKDKLKNTYIFTETSPMQYTVQLDDYTLENETFNEKYEKASSRDKGILNVDKFFKMMNMADYKAAYALLDETFKLNNFKTETEFETYMQSNIFRYNKVSYQTYSDKITDLLTFKLKLTDATGKDKREIQFNVVMKLGEGTDFTMSFEIVKE